MWEPLDMYQLKSLAPLGINATDSSNHTRSFANKPRQFGATDQPIQYQSMQSQTKFSN